MGNISLAEVWHQVEYFLSEGVSIIPIRDKDDESGVAKSPYIAWTKNTKTALTKDELWNKMDHFGTTAVGLVCGSVSGNLEVIDIDSKYEPGIDGLLFKDIQEIYPDLWAKLRIHKTPSGGYHILYKIDGHIPDGNRKLAGRLATDFEKEQYKINNPQVKKELKEINFLETRGENGYVAAPPSFNYSVFTDNLFPVITWEERCSLLQLCQNYNKLVKIEPTPRPVKQHEGIYDVNPFEDFNKRCDPTELVERFDWRFSHERGNFIWYTRPGKKKGVSLSFNKDKCIFYSFSASTELDAPKGYNPSSFLAIYQFDGDKSKTYSWLVNQGYGALKPQIEQNIIQRAKVTGKAAPANLSQSSKELLLQEQEQYSDVHPYGIFWGYDDEDKLKISRERLYNVSHELGIRLHNDEPVLIQKPFIYKIKPNDFYELLKAYIKEEDVDFYERICNVFEAFLQNSGSYTLSRIKNISTENIIKDKEFTAYKFFENCFIEITEDKIVSYDYLGCEKLIWHHKILNRKWFPEDKLPDVCKYTEFLHLAIGIDDQLQKVVGYLAHDFKDENTGYIITLTENCPDPKQGGGSGKNIFGNLFRYITTVCTVAGTQVQFNEKLLQSWNDERIFFMADVPKKFDFLYMKEISTGYGMVKKLWKDERTVPPDEMPKLLVNTNYSFDESDGGLKRRIIPIEFTNFFTAQGGVDTYFGCMFPAGWDESDWIGFDYFNVYSIQKYFTSKGKIKPGLLSYTGWEKQFKQKFSELTFKFIEENIQAWYSDEGFVNNEDFKKEYDGFCYANNINKSYQLTSVLMNKALASYCEKHEIKFENDIQKKINSIKYRGRIFNKIDQ